MWPYQSSIIYHQTKSKASSSCCARPSIISYYPASTSIRVYESLDITLRFGHTPAAPACRSFVWLMMLAVISVVTAAIAIYLYLRHFVRSPQQSCLFLLRVRGFVYMSMNAFRCLDRFKTSNYVRTYRKTKSTVKKYLGDRVILRQTDLKI